MTETEKQDYWDVPLTPAVEEQLDMELISQLNQLEEDLPAPEEQTKEDIWVGHLTMAVLLIAITLFALSYILNYSNLQPLNFWQDSIELIKDPAVIALQEPVVIISASRNRGTGFNIDPKGTIVTNEHVVRDKQWVDVRFGAGELYRSTSWQSFPQLDLAVLEIAGEHLPTLTLSEEAVPEMGEQVLIIGNPLGFEKLVVQGTVTGMTNLTGWHVPVLMIAAPIHKGSSGSPVLNSDGQVVAVIFATMVKSADTSEEEIIGLAVPIEYLLEKLN